MIDMTGINANVFGFRLRRAMSIRRVKQRDFAAAIGRSESTVKKWRGGYQIPAADTIAKIADVLRVSLDFLTGRTQEMEVQHEP